MAFYIKGRRGFPERSLARTSEVDRDSQGNDVQLNLWHTNTDSNHIRVLVRDAHGKAVRILRIAIKIHLVSLSAENGIG